MPDPQIDDRDWSTLTLGERIRQIEVEGYLLIPNLLAEYQIDCLKKEADKLKTTPADYSPHQQTRSNIQFFGGAITNLIAHRPTITFLRKLLGNDIILSHYSYARSEPGHPGISIHTDGQPYGSKIFGYQGSIPVMVRVLYYLDDLTPEVSPFRVIPRSHLSLHADGNPYQRFESHPEEVMVTARAGSAMFINHKVFHGNYPNLGDRSRSMLAIAYRPAWAGPLMKVEEWDPKMVTEMPEMVKVFLANPNTRHWIFEGENKPPNMANQAPGINASRWNQE